MGSEILIRDRRTTGYYVENPEVMQKTIEKGTAEGKKGYKLEGNFKENCNSAVEAKMRLVSIAIDKSFNN